jgi:protein-S-isoprenylcysteine O-methyltransferase Ste14
MTAGLYRITETFFLAWALVTLAAPVYLPLFWTFLPLWQKRRPFWAWLMIVGVAGIALALLFSWRGQWTPYAVQFPAWVRVLGWAAALSAVAIIGAAQRLITLRGRAFLAELRPAERVQLKTEGPFGVVRHPIYASMALYDVGMFLATGYYLVLGAFVVWMSVVRWECWREERTMIERFGDAYLAYRERVPMLLPCLIPKHRR